MKSLRKAMTDSIIRALLRKEQRAKKRTVRKQSEADHLMVARRRAAEDRTMARELGIEVDDFV